MKFTKNKLAFFILISVFFFVFMFLAITFLRPNKLGQFIYDFHGTVIRRNHIGNEYNINENVFHYLENSLHWELGQLDHRTPWGISKTEIKTLQKRKLLEESTTRLVFGPYTEEHPDPRNRNRRDSFFIEYHFNRLGQMYKIVETSGIKYLYVEDNSVLAETYRRITLENEDYYENYALFDSLASPFDKKFIFPSFLHGATLYWKDENGEDKNMEMNIWISSNEILRETGKKIVFDEEDELDKKWFKIILDGDFRIVRYHDEEEGTHVTYRQEIKKVSDEAILGESVFINTLLVD